MEVAAKEVRTGFCCIEPAKTINSAMKLPVKGTAELAKINTKNNVIKTGI